MTMEYIPTSQIEKMQRRINTLEAQNKRLANDVVKAVEVKSTYKKRYMDLFNKAVHYGHIHSCVECGTDLFAEEMSKVTIDGSICKNCDL